MRLLQSIGGGPMKPRVLRHEVEQPLDQSYRLIPLPQGKNAIVDSTDFEWLSQWTWRLRKANCKTYVFRQEGGQGRRKGIHMHRLILGLNQKGIGRADHINGDSLDNRRANLRECSNSENQYNRRKQSNNSSGYKGVYLSKRRGSYQARIGVRGRSKHIGYYKSPVEAALAYDRAAKIEHKEFAVLNFPGGDT
jgi:HNH endonuclease/AP2 domain